MAILIVDLDGVIWHGNKLVKPGIPCLITKLRDSGHKIYFLTNNSTKNSYGYQKKLSRMGIKAPLSEIVCAANTVGKYLENKIKGLKKKPNVFVIGENGLKKEIARLPVNIMGLNDKNKIDYVVVGLDKKFNYKKLAKAQRAILLGAQFVAANADTTLPINMDTVVPGCGAILSSIITATNKKPYIVGKPNPYIIKNILKKERGNGKVFIIGDRLDTDIMLGRKIGIGTILVLSGATKKQYLEESNVKPKYVLKDFSEIGKINLR
jgi:4-nitrophenyl phosphatase